MCNVFVCWCVCVCVCLYRRLCVCVNITVFVCVSSCPAAYLCLRLSNYPSICVCCKDCVCVLVCVAVHVFVCVVPYMSAYTLPPIDGSAYGMPAARGYQYYTCMHRELYHLKNYYLRKMPQSPSLMG